MTEEERKKIRSNQGSLLNPTILGRPLFPSTSRIAQGARGLAQSLVPDFPEDGGVDPSTQTGMAMSGVRDFGPPPSFGPLVNTNRFFADRPPREVSLFRDPSQQWDVRPSPITSGAGTTISTQEAIAQNNANMTDQQRSFYQDYMFRLGMGELSQPSQGVVRSVSQPPATGIAGGQMDSGFAPSIDQGLASARFSPTPASRADTETPSPIVESGPVRLTATGAETTGERGLRPIQTARGTIYATPEQAVNFSRRSTAYNEGGTRTPAQQQALLAQIRQNAAERAPQREEREAERQKVLRDRHFEHNIKIAERRAQEALDPARGFGQVTEGMKQRGEQYSAQAADLREQAAGRRQPMSREPLNVGGVQVMRGSMGQYRPVVDPSKIRSSATKAAAQSTTAGSGFGGFDFGGFDSYNQSLDLLGDPFSYLRRFGMGV